LDWTEIRADETNFEKSLREFKPTSLIPNAVQLCLVILRKLENFILGGSGETLAYLESLPGLLTGNLVDELANTEIKLRVFITAMFAVSKEFGQIVQFFLFQSIKFQMEKIISTGQGLSIELPKVSSQVTSDHYMFLFSREWKEGERGSFWQDGDLHFEDETDMCLSDYYTVLKNYFTRQDPARLEEYHRKSQKWTHYITKLPLADDFFYFERARTTADPEKLWSELKKLYFDPNLFRDCENYSCLPKIFQPYAFIGAQVTKTEIADALGRAGANPKLVQDYLEARSQPKRVTLEEFPQKDLTLLELDVAEMAINFLILVSERFGPRNHELFFLRNLLAPEIDIEPKYTETLFAEIVINIQIKELCQLLDLFYPGLSTILCSAWSEFAELQKQYIKPEIHGFDPRIKEMQIINKEELPAEIRKKLCTRLNFVQKYSLHKCPKKMERDMKGSLFTTVDGVSYAEHEIDFNKMTNDEIMQKLRIDDLLKGPSRRKKNEQMVEDLNLKGRQIELASKPVDIVLQELGLEEHQNKKKSAKKPAAKKAPAKKTAKPPTPVNIKVEKSPPKPAAITKVDKKKSSPPPKPVVSAKIEKEPPPIPAAAEAKSLPAVEEKQPPSEVEDKNICAVCLDAPRSYIALPCAHLVYCGPCLASLTYCAICRKEIGSKVRVYF
jgi:hypothetical protein